VGSLLLFGTSFLAGCERTQPEDAAELRARIEPTLKAKGDDSLGRLERLSSLVNRLRQIEKDPKADLRGAKAMLRWARRDIRFAKTHRRALDVQLKRLEGHRSYAGVAIRLRLEAHSDVTTLKAMLEEARQAALISSDSYIPTLFAIRALNQMSGRSVASIAESR